MGHVDDQVRIAIEAELRNFLTRQTAQLQSYGREMRAVVEAIENASTGGKHLRPLLCVSGWRAAGGAALDRRVVRAAASLELLHTGALVHDDVFDRSETRRGRPSGHRELAMLHQRRSWRGRADAFGTSGAILLGDLFLLWSDEALRGCGLPPEAVVRGFEVFDTMRIEVMAGQYLELTLQASATAALTDAMQVMRLKSARYTVERPLQLGAVLAGGGAEILSALQAYGAPLGEAFQLRDDLLGAIGDPAVTGKPAGDDIREGKRTVLLALAYEAADATQRSTLDRHVGEPGLDPEALGSVREVLHATGAIDATESMISTRRSEAIAALHRISDPEARDTLERLAVAMTDRVT